MIDRTKLMYQNQPLVTQLDTDFHYCHEGTVLACATPYNVVIKGISADDPLLMVRKTMTMEQLLSESMRKQRVTLPEQYELSIKKYGSVLHSVSPNKHSDMATELIYPVMAPGVYGGEI